MEKFLKSVGIGISALIIATLLATLSAWFVMLLINWLFTPTALMAVFGVAKIGFWKAWGISFLTSMLFKSTGSSK